MNAQKSPGRPAGSCNIKPSRESVRSYYALLRSAADGGDINAAGKLIELDLLERQRCSEQAEISRHGV